MVVIVATMRGMRWLGTILVAATVVPAAHAGREVEATAGATCAGTALRRLAAGKLLFMSAPERAAVAWR